MNDSLTKEHGWFAASCVATWISIRNQEARKNNPEGPIFGPTAADAEHSALLQRLFSGKKPLPKPPPKTFSSPNYTLGDGLPYEVMEMWEAAKTMGDEYLICIDQGLEWKWEDKAGGMLRHKNGDLYTFRPYPKDPDVKRMIGVLRRVTLLSEVQENTNGKA